jgi:hypothetical protein
MPFTRIRSGGVVISRGRLLKDLGHDLTQEAAVLRKLRLVAGPHRKAGKLCR